MNHRARFMLDVDSEGFPMQYDAPPASTRIGNDELVCEGCSKRLTYRGEVPFCVTCVGNNYPYANAYGPGKSGIIHWDEFAVAAKGDALRSYIAELDEAVAIVNGVSLDDYLRKVQP